MHQQKEDGSMDWDNARIFLAIGRAITDCP